MATLTVLGLSACDVNDRYFLEDVALAALENPGPTELLLASHHIEKGGGVLLLIRRFDSGQIRTVDDEHFQKLSVFIPSYTVGVPVAVERDSGVIVRYSEGSSAFAGRGAGYYAHQATGAVTILQKSSDQMKAKLELIVQPIAARDDFPSKTAIHIDKEFTFKRKTFEEVTPWIGRRSDRIDAEVYPPRWTDNLLRK